MLLTATAAATVAPASATRHKQQREHEQSQYRSDQRKVLAFSPMPSDSQQSEQRQRQPQSIKERRTDELDELAVVAMFITSAAELVPGVTGLGVKLQSEITGPPEHERVTAPANDAPTGSTLKL